MEANPTSYVTNGDIDSMEKHPNIYYALEHSGYSKEDILKWIDKIRRFGLDASFIQKEKKLRESLKEISEILDAIKRKAKR